MSDQADHFPSMLVQAYLLFTVKCRWLFSMTFSESSTLVTDANSNIDRRGPDCVYGIYYLLSRIGGTIARVVKVY